MSMIEGVGDEVTIFVVVVIIVFLILVAWISTFVADRPLISVIVLDRNSFQRILDRLRQRNFQVISIRHLFQSRTAQNNDNASAQDNQNNTDNIPAENSADVNNSNITEVAGSSTQMNENIGLEHDDTADNQTSVEETIGQTTTPDDDSSPSDMQRNAEADTLVTESNFPTSQPLQQTDVQHIPEQQLRQRRVAFFEKEASDGAKTASLSEQTGLILEPAVTDSATTDSDINLPTQKNSEDGNADNETRSENISVQEESSASSNNNDTSERLDGHIRIKIKYLTDQQRWVQAKPEDTVGYFKRQHFASELAEDMIVRLIFNGRELREETSTLQSHNLMDTSVVHCLVSQNNTSQQSTNSHHSASELDLGAFMFPLFGVILVLIWYCRVTYRNYFNAMSTLALLGITFLFMIAFLASWRMHRVQEYENHQHQQRQQSSNN